MSIMPAVDDRELERSVIGALLVAPDRFAEVEHILAADFVDARHQAIWRAMAMLRARRRACDPIALRGQLADLGLATPPVIESLSTAEASAISASSLTTHAEMLRDAAARRRFREAAKKLSELVDNQELALGSVGDLGERIWREVADSAATVDEPVHISAVISEAFEELERIHRGEIVAVPTGLDPLDSHLLGGGLPLSEMSTLAGKTGKGKTALAMQIAESVASRGGGVLMFSLEMRRIALLMRRMAAAVQVNQGELLSRDRYAAVLERILAWAAKASSWPFLFDDKADLTVAEIRSKARKAKGKMPGLRLVVVDYLQLAGGERGKRYGSRTEEVTAISRGLKSLAKELGVAVLALSQFNRELDRENRRPRLSDLRESGSIEHDSAVVLLLHCAEKDGAPPSPAIDYELAIAKQRNGTHGGFIPLTFRPAWTTFEERHEQPDEDEQPPPPPEPPRDLDLFERRAGERRETA